VTIEQAAAAAWALPATHYTLNYLTGRWTGEWTLNQESVRHGARVLESRRGSTGHQANPWFAIQAGESDENYGEVWFGALAWSGSWRITVEQDQFDAVRVTGGFNPFDFGYVLQPGKSLETPVFYGGYSSHGLGGASRLLHQFEAANILPRRPGQENGPKPRPVIYNSWEATEFRVSEAGQMALAEKAAALGIDRFVMDDGWFGQRKDDHAGLGDWYVNKEKFSVSSTNWSPRTILPSSSGTTTATGASRAGTSCRRRNRNASTSTSRATSTGYSANCKSGIRSSRLSRARAEAAAWISGS